MAEQPEIRKEWLEKDYYKTLGVPKDADAATIKKTYRKLARELHPDATPGDTKAEARFKDVTEAYDVVGNADTRKSYDEARALYGSGGRMRFGGGGQPGGGFGGGQRGYSQADLNDLFSQAGQGGGGGFSDVFSSLFNRGGGQQRQPRAERGSDVESEVTLSFRDALHGVTLPLRLQSEGTCETCRGSGARPGSNVTTCPTCQGTGATVRNQGGFAFSEPCRECHGRGVLTDDPCPTCHGSGQAVSTRTVNARIPAGVRDGQKIRLKGKGGEGSNGGPAGDLFIVVRVTPDQVFGRDGANVTITLPVAFDEAALGADISVPIPDGTTVKLRIPAGTSNGRKFRVKGKGAHPANKEPGDLIATIQVAVPPTMTDEQRTAVEALRAARGETDPRADLMSKLNR